MIQNPWKNLYEGPDMICAMDDKDKLKRFELTRQTNFLKAYPQPFLGSPDAPIYLLLANPGMASEDKQKEMFDLQGATKTKLRLNLEHKCLDFPFLDNEISPGHKWWRRVFKSYETFLEKSTPYIFSNAIAQTFFVVELVPYHSISFDSSFLGLHLPSVAYNLQLVNNAITSNKTIIVCRSVKNWFNAVERLASYDKTYFLAKNRAIVLSDSTLFPSLWQFSVEQFQLRLK